LFVAGSRTNCFVLRVGFEDRSHVFSAEKTGEGRAASFLRDRRKKTCSQIHRKWLCGRRQTALPSSCLPAGGQGFEGIFYVLSADKTENQRVAKM